MCKKNQDNYTFSMLSIVLEKFQLELCRLDCRMTKPVIHWFYTGTIEIGLQPQVITKQETAWLEDAYLRIT